MNSAVKSASAFADRRKGLPRQGPAKSQPRSCQDPVKSQPIFQKGWPANVAPHGAQG